MKPRGIVIHTVGVRGDATAASIRKHHMAPAPKDEQCSRAGHLCPVCQIVHGNGWADLGYHRVIRKSGAIEIGRALFKTGAHTQGANDTWGVCVVGDGDSETWTPQQWEAVLGLCAEWCVHQDWTQEHVHGHREAPARLKAAPTGKTCPGKLVDMNEVRRRIALRLAGLA